jgi:hypothetical protein
MSFQLVAESLNFERHLVHKPIAGHIQSSTELELKSVREFLPAGISK